MAFTPKIVGDGDSDQPRRVQLQPNAALVEALSEYLADAMEGSLRGIVFGIVRSDGTSATGWYGDADATVLLSAASMVVYRLAKDIDGN